MLLMIYLIYLKTEHYIFITNRMGIKIHSLAIIYKYLFNNKHMKRHAFVFKHEKNAGFSHA